MCVVSLRNFLFHEKKVDKDREDRKKKQRSENAHEESPTKQGDDRMKTQMSNETKKKRKERKL